MKRDKSLNNKGLTLVELLIAIVVLAIIVVPLLHAFITSARINAKSKEKLRLTQIAQDIMEGLKAYTLEDIAYEFNYPNSGSISEHPSGFKIINPNIIDGGI